MRTSVLSSCIVLGLAHVGAAQGAPPGAHRWPVSSELGLNFARGNSSYTMLTSGLRVGHTNTRQLEFDFSTAVTYGESKGAGIARRVNASLKADYRPTGVFSPFVFTTAERRPLGASPCWRTREWA